MQPKVSIARESCSRSSPDEGVVWMEQTPQTVYWEWVGTSVEFVKLQLVRGGKVIASLSASTPNVGEAAINVPSLDHLADHSEGAWRVRISDAKRSNTLFAFSEPFTIAPAASNRMVGATCTLRQRGRGLLLPMKMMCARPSPRASLPRNHQRGTTAVSCARVLRSIPSSTSGDLRWTRGMALLTKL